MSRSLNASKGEIADDVEAARLPSVKIPRNDRFWYRFFPHRWLVLGDRVLPLLSKLRHSPGLDGVDKNGDTTLAELRASKEGCTIIRPNIRGPKTSYLRRHRGTNGPVWLSEWEIPHFGSSHISSDMDGYTAFLIWLVDSGKVSPPTEQALSTLEDRAQKRYDEYSAKAYQNPRVKHLADIAAAELEVIAAENKRWSVSSVGEIVEDDSDAAPAIEAAPPRPRKARAKAKAKKAAKPKPKPIRSKKAAAEAGNR